VEPVYLYQIDTPQAPPTDAPPAKGKAAPVDPGVGPKSGSDTVDVLTGLWQEVELISLADGVFAADTNSVKTLHKVNFCLPTFFCSASSC
jgi:hypothetical protein